jgi:hypothetical protein
MSLETAAGNPAAKVGAYRPRDPLPLSRFVVLAVAASLAASLIMIPFEAWHFSVIAPLDPARPDPNAAYLPGEQLPSLLVGLGGLLELVTFLVCGFLSLKWVYRVSMNAHAMAGGMSMTPGWNVGYFFIPIANLWLPFKGLTECWAVSASPADWKSVKTPSLMRGWWSCWIGANAVGWIAFKIQLSAGTVGAAQASDIAVVASNLLGAPASVLFILLVRRLSALQAGALAGRASA